MKNQIGRFMVSKWSIERRIVRHLVGAAVIGRIFNDEANPQSYLDTVIKMVEHLHWQKDALPGLVEEADSKLKIFNDEIVAYILRQIKGKTADQVLCHEQQKLTLLIQDIITVRLAMRKVSDFSAAKIRDIISYIQIDIDIPNNPDIEELVGSCDDSAVEAQDVLLDFGDSDPAVFEALLRPFITEISDS